MDGALKQADLSYLPEQVCKRHIKTVCAADSGSGKIVSIIF